MQQHSLGYIKGTVTKRFARHRTLGCLAVTTEHCRHRYGETVVFSFLVLRSSCAISRLPQKRCFVLQVHWTFSRLYNHVKTALSAYPLDPARYSVSWRSGRTIMHAPVFHFAHTPERTQRGQKSDEHTRPDRAMCETPAIFIDGVYKVPDHMISTNSDIATFPPKLHLDRTGRAGRYSAELLLCEPT